MNKPEIRIGRLSECTFEQTLQLKQRGWEGYHDTMAQHYPAFPRPAAPLPDALDRMLDGFGTNGIRPQLSIVGFADGKPVGFVFIAVRTVHGKKLAWNGGTAVFPEYRGFGIAKLMMVEANRVIREQEIDCAYLEVVAKNDHAIAAYEKGGFVKRDKTIGMTREEALEAPIFPGEPPASIRLSSGKPEEVASLPFYRQDAAWGCMWHSMKTGEALIARDESGEAVGYVLCTRSRNAEGQLSSVTLRQVEVSPSYSDRESLFRLLLNEALGPYDKPCVRKTGDLSMANPEAINALLEAGFVINYEQYVMTLTKE
ncbi:MAG: hypothetical protein K0Q59_3354 [Paenibacillus sp.]|nr:hypothetical protein [Paenibacillus sp.]